MFVLGEIPDDALSGQPEASNGRPRPKRSWPRPRPCRGAAARGWRSAHGLLRRRDPRRRVVGGRRRPGVDEGSLGPDGTVHSEASVADLDLDQGDATAELISAECDSGIDGPTAPSSFVNTEIEGNPLPTSFPPNTELDLGQFGTHPNRQVVDGNPIEVTAIAAEVTSEEFTGTVEIANAVCGVTTAETEAPASAPVAAEPGFTG